jgi:hypothetical protein
MGGSTAAAAQPTAPGSEKLGKHTRGIERSETEVMMLVVKRGEKTERWNQQWMSSS